MKHDSLHSRSGLSVALGLLGVLVVALILRLWSLDFGLPDWYHPDEPLKARAVARIAGGELNPGSFYHPSFMLYAAAAMLRWRSAGGAPFGDEEAVYAGRLTVALLGTATVLLTFVAGRSAGGPFVGLVAALLLAVAPLHVVCSHYLKEDVPLAFWGVATYLASLRLVSEGRRRDYALAGFLAGVAAGTKYTGLLFAGLPWLGHRERRAMLTGAAAVSTVPAGTLRVTFAAAVVGFFSVTPFALLDPVRFLTGVGHEGAFVFTGMAGIAVAPLPYAWTFHLRYSILPGFGIVPTLLAFAGFITALRQRRADLRLLTALVAVLYVVFESSPYKPPPNFDRHLVPLLPFLAVLAAAAVDQVRQRLGPSLVQSVTSIAGALVLLSAGPSAWSAVRDVAAMSTDTRAAARDWLVEHACRGERVVLEGALAVAGTALPSYVPTLPPQCRATYVYSLEREPSLLEDADVVVATSFMYERFLRFASAPPAARRFYRDFFRTHHPVAELAPAYRSYGFHNPTIRIYRLRGPGAGTSHQRSGNGPDRRPDAHD